MIRDFVIEPVCINTEIEELVIKERVILDPYGEMKRTHYVSLQNGKEYPLYEKMEAELEMVRKERDAYKTAYYDLKKSLERIIRL